MNPPVFGNPFAGWFKTHRPAPVKQVTVSGIGKCQRKGHRPPTKDGFCSRCNQPIVVAGELLMLGDAVAVEAGIARKI